LSVAVFKSTTYFLSAKGHHDSGPSCCSFLPERHVRCRCLRVCPAASQRFFCTKDATLANEFSRAQ
jgi:hypothetical protein